MKVINVKKYYPENFLVFSSRSSGKLLREELELDKLDGTDTKIILVFPKNLYTITANYIEGLLGDTINKIKNRKIILNQYIFDVPEHINIEHYIDDYINRMVLINRRS